MKDITYHSTGFAYIISIIFFIFSITLFYGSLFAATLDTFLVASAFLIVAILSYVWISKFRIIIENNYFIYKTISCSFKILYSDIKEIKHLVGVPSSSPTEMRGFLRLKIIHKTGNFTINESMFSDFVLNLFINKIFDKNKKVKLNAGAQKIHDKKFNTLRKDYIVPLVKILLAITIIQAIIVFVLKVLI
jgi:hypothetical protein